MNIMLTVIKGNLERTHSWESDGSGLQINLVQGLIRLGLIEELNLAITVHRPLEWLRPSLISPWTKLIWSPDHWIPRCDYAQDSP